jgi:hypothetical protein
MVPLYCQAESLEYSEWGPFRLGSTLTVLQRYITRLASRNNLSVRWSPGPMLYVAKVLAVGFWASFLVF